LGAFVSKETAVFAVVDRKENHMGTHKPIDKKEFQRDVKELLYKKKAV